MDSAFGRQMAAFGPARGTLWAPMRGGFTPPSRGGFPRGDSPSGGPPAPVSTTPARLRRWNSAQMSIGGLTWCSMAATPGQKAIRRGVPPNGRADGMHSVDGVDATDAADALSTTGRVPHVSRVLWDFSLELV